MITANQIRSLSFLLFYKSNTSLASSFYWEKGQACWMHRGLQEHDFSNHSQKGHGQVGMLVKGRAMPWNMDKKRRGRVHSPEFWLDTTTADEALSWTKPPFPFSNLYGWAKHLLSCIIIHLLRLTHSPIFIGYKVIKGLQGSSNVTSWKTFHLNFQERSEGQRPLYFKFFMKEGPQCVVDVPKVNW